MEGRYIPWDWDMVLNEGTEKMWLEPCEESYYYAAKWHREGRKSVLDLGCGLGRHALLFAKCGFKVTAADISREAIDYLKKSCRETGAELTAAVADMNSLPFADNAFDCVFAMHSAGHCDTEGMKRILAETARVLKPEGTVFMTLCSKETYTYQQGGLPRIDENTLVKTDGPEKDVPHFFADPELIRELFADFELVRIRMIDDCYGRGRWKNEKHYFIEAVIHKEPSRPDYSGIIGKEVNCTVDRPLGTAHPRHPNIVYPINYGYADGIIGGDGHWQDVYIVGVDRPLSHFKGKVIAVYHRLNDTEDKWIAAPADAEKHFSADELLDLIDFQERFFDGELFTD
ncbi:MAG: methyltransferase domain-containing protein [Ruminococcus sp.]|nr:methyltransferase domain-containing protein [Ruminococcus sp.]